MNYIIDAVTTNYWNFKGRSSRKAYWMLALVSFALQFVMNILSGVMEAGSDMGAGTAIVVLPLSLVLLLASIFLFIPFLSMAIRRSHDVNYSYWYALIPLFNIYLFILMMFARGTVGANNYGEDPTDTPNGTTNPEATATPATPLAANPQN